MALLGTALLPTHVEQLQGYGGIIVALDPDAYQKTLKFTQELRGKLFHNKIVSAKLEDDLKYRREHDILLIGERANNFMQAN